MIKCIQEKENLNLQYYARFKKDQKEGLAVKGNELNKEPLKTTRTERNALAFGE